MQARLNAADARFLEAVEAFIRDEWSARLAGLRGAVAVPAGIREGWFAALAARGWAVPHWPVAQGGTGWSPRQLYLWRVALASAGAPRPAPAAIDWVGPALWRWGDAMQQACWLPGIRELSERWCVGLAEPVAEWQLERIATVARAAPGSGYRIDGVKTWVADADTARWLLLLARTGAAGAEPERALSLFVVDLEAPGVTVTPVTLLDGRTRVYRVALADVPVPATHRLGAAGVGLAAVQTLAEAAEREFEPAVGLARLAAGLAAAARDLPGDQAERLADEAGFAGRLAELGVELAGLEALEWRWLAEEVGAISRSRPPVDRDLDIAPTVRGRDLEIAPTVLRLRRAAIAQRIAALSGEAFGYYSLPYPDPVTIDNEGPIGHHYALAALQGMLVGRLPPIDGGTSEAYRDRIANRLFGL